MVEIFDFDREILEIEKRMNAVTTTEEKFELVTEIHTKSIKAIWGMVLELNGRLKALETLLEMIKDKTEKKEKPLPS